MDRAPQYAAADLALYGEALADLPSDRLFTLDDRLSEAPNAAALAARLRPAPAA